MTSPPPASSFMIPDDARPGTPDDPLWRDHDDNPLFRHRPKVIGPEITVRIDRDAIAWTNGKYSGRLPLHQIESVRIAFRPANLYAQRYRVDVKQRLGQNIWFSNVSWRGMVEMESHDAPFSAFVRELARRVRKASPKAQFIGGEPGWRYWPAAIMTIGFTLALLYIGTEALRTASWSLGLVVGLVGVYTAWIMGLWLRKNWPSTFDPDAIPSDLLPPVKTRQP